MQKIMASFVNVFRGVYFWDFQTFDNFLLPDVDDSFKQNFKNKKNILRMALLIISFVIKLKVNSENRFVMRGCLKLI